MKRLLFVAFALLAAMMVIGLTVALTRPSTDQTEGEDAAEAETV